MLKRGYRSSASIPISKKGKLIGSLNIYSDIPNFFAKENFSLLKEIAGDISFALEKIENERWMRITAQALEKSSSFVIIINQNLVIEYANKAAEGLLAETDDETLTGKSCNLINKRLKNKTLTRKFFEEIRGDKPFNDLLIYSKKEGALVYLDTTIIRFEDQKKNSYFIVSGKNITEEVGLQNSVNRMLFYDFETDMPNRRAFLETAEIYIKLIDKNKQAAIIIIDPHNFTYINDILGYEAANRLLKAIGLRLTEILKKSDLVAKALGSKFFCLIKDIDAKYTLHPILKRIQNELAKPFDTDSDKITLSFHIGIAIYPDDASDAVNLLARAETALLHNKRTESAPYQPSFFTRQIEQEMRKASQLKESLANALTRKEFVLYYQPYFDPVSKSIKGAEALLRWEKEGKTIMPSEFIPFLEKSNMISEVENWIIDQVCHDMSKWQKKGLKPMPVSINISPSSFSKTELISHIVSMASKHHADRSLLTIEITERLFMSNLKQAAETLNLLKKEGMKIAIDDFGTGYSSLSYLEQLPVDILKIDISFIRNMTKSSHAAAIVQAIISVAHALSLATIAEGVETDEQLDILKKLKCDAVQGWLFAKAMPEEQFESFLSK